VLDLGEPRSILLLALHPPDLADIEKTVLTLKEVTIFFVLWHLFIPDHIISAPVIAAAVLLNTFQLTTYIHLIITMILSCDLSLNFFFYDLLLAVDRPLAHHYIIPISLPM